MMFLLWFSKNLHWLSSHLPRLTPNLEAFDVRSLFLGSFVLAGTLYYQYPNDSFAVMANSVPWMDNAVSRISLLWTRLQSRTTHHTTLISGIFSFPDREPLHLHSILDCPRLASQDSWPLPPLDLRCLLLRQVEQTYSHSLVNIPQTPRSSPITGF